MCTVCVYGVVCKVWCGRYVCAVMCGVVGMCVM